MKLLINQPAPPAKGPANAQALAIGHSSFRPSFVIRHSPFVISARAFTLMELMVSITILITIILAVNVTFSGASQTVSISHATTDLMANVRATQQLIERDLRGLDHNSYLVIRGRLNDVTKGDASLRFDQISFISQEPFQNTTGANTASPFTDSSTAGAAHVWWGQLIMEMNAPPDPSYNVTGYAGPRQDIGHTQLQLPTGAWDDLGGNRQIRESGFVLGREPTLLFPGPVNGASQVSPAGNPVMAYQSLDGTLSPGTITGLDGAAHITSSRYGVVAQTPAQIMQSVASARASGALVPEADALTYRFRALQSIYHTEVSGPTANPFVNGYYRMTPVVMAGVSSFKVEWTDGAVYGAPSDTTILGVATPDPHNVSGSLTGQLKWYGPTLLSSGNPIADNKGFGRNFGTDNSATDPNVELFINSQAGRAGTGDHYLAVFTYTNRSKWPKALRFTYHVYGDRLGGRDFVQVVNLP